MQVLSPAAFAELVSWLSATVREYPNGRVVKRDGLVCFYTSSDLRACPLMCVNAHDYEQAQRVNLQHGENKMLHVDDQVG